MAPVRVFDALNNGSFTCLECKDGSKFGGTLLKVNFCGEEDNQPACLEVTPDGLVLHFNSARGGHDLQAESVWLSDILAEG